MVKQVRIGWDDELKKVKMCCDYTLYSFLLEELTPLTVNKNVNQGKNNSTFCYSAVHKNNSRYIFTNCKHQYRETAIYPHMDGRGFYSLDRNISFSSSSQFGFTIVTLDAECYTCGLVSLQLAAQWWSLKTTSSINNTSGDFHVAIFSKRVYFHLTAWPKKSDFIDMLKKAYCFK